MRTEGVVMPSKDRRGPLWGWESVSTVKWGALEQLSCSVFWDPRCQDKRTRGDLGPAGPFELCRPTFILQTTDIKYRTGLNPNTVWLIRLADVEAQRRSHLPGLRMAVWAQAMRTAFASILFSEH